MSVSGILPSSLLCDESGADCGWTNCAPRVLKNWHISSATTKTSQSKELRVIVDVAIVDVAAVEFRFSAVEFVEKLSFDEADKKVSITRSHFSAHSDSVNMLVIVIRERKAVKRENEFSEANKRFGVRAHLAFFPSK